MDPDCSDSQRPWKGAPAHTLGFTDLVGDAILRLLLTFLCICASRNNEDLREFSSGSEKCLAYERLEDSDSHVTDNASDESDAKLKPATMVDADQQANENVYMEMTQAQVA